MRRPGDRGMRIQHREFLASYERTPVVAAGVPLSSVLPVEDRARQLKYLLRGRIVTRNMPSLWTADLRLRRIRASAQAS